MDYLILFMEGIITFISPCILPMLPIYVSYFMGDGQGADKKRALTNAFGFVLGFSAVFALLGAAAGGLGQIIQQYMNGFNIIGGGILVLFGLNYMGVLKFSWLERTYGLQGKAKFKSLNIGSSLLFGMIFAIGWTPCVGTFLGSALMIAANSQDSMVGVTMLLTYSVGLGIPFILSALLIDSLKGAFDFIKRNYVTINRISGVMLIIIGILMMTGYLNLLLAWLTV